MRESTAKKIMEKVKRDYGKIAKDFDRTRRGGWKDFELFDEFVKPGYKVLDIGCGNGRLKEYLPDDIEYHGCDNNEEFIKIAKKRGGEFKVGDFLDLPYPDKHFDLVLSVAAFHHIPSRKLRRNAVKEVKRVMKPDAKAFFLVWNLWQKKYIPVFLKSCLRFVLTFGRYSLYDFFVPWGGKLKRYYYAFTRRELKKMFDRVGLAPSKKNFYIVFKK